MKGIGVGFEFGLRNNKQEGYNYKLAKDKLSPANFKIEVLAGSVNPLQTYGCSVLLINFKHS